ncbi:hypothetical protein [Myroides odoratimimus]|uniref:hypothetical protein n=1 Tax=Myroides odoratimimus TaxID=76832 RepID=UPI002575717E|nr:hypothetical protein [Myroides odoratimimus]MDM1093413.1 hypothetical protein [Myroides odoratimimus]
MYSNYLNIEEFKTHARSEEINEIIRQDDTIAYASIDMAIEFASSKLMKHYDIEKIFSAIGKDRNPLVLKVVKDIALWELIGLANPHINYEDKKFRYEESVSWLTAVYKGMPTTLPKIEEEPSKTSSFTWNSNPKRTNHY